MKTSDFNYDLPADAIAQEPLRQRDQCRLAMFQLKTQTLSHHLFSDLPSLLQAGDCLVLNNSQVLPCRIPCQRSSGGAAEIFLLRPDLLPAASMQVMMRPLKKLKQGSQLYPTRYPDAGSFIIESIQADGYVTVGWHGRGDLTASLLEELGLPPLPPYIHRERLPQPAVSKNDREFYQAIYAREAGSCAAPTAGLHFTEAVLSLLRKNLIEVHALTHHVGAGTFLPVKTQTLEEHIMHEERFNLDDSTAQALKTAKSQGRRIIAVGTTSLRALESAYKENTFQTGWQSTRLFIKPGYQFSCIDGLITNFHQPASTLMALVSALTGREILLKSYKDCLSRGYRFLSYGDCMLICTGNYLPKY